jgi:mRNA-degrading endonuclease YafQ of YafQ-DinJ toxin-antitoxin module
LLLLDLNVTLGIVFLGESPLRQRFKFLDFFFLKVVLLETIAQAF